MKKSSIPIIIVICILLMSAGFYYIYFMFNNEIKRIKIGQQEQYTEAQKTNQFLLSTIDWSSRRQKLILFMRDEIVMRRGSIGSPIHLEKAYLIAENNVYECEKYSSIDPLLLLATQNIESAFVDTVVSPKGAIGLNQLMPSTARLLCLALNITYRKNILYDIEVNTRLSVRLLDILYAVYEDYEVVLADYNGGPYSAYYYKNEKSKLNSETAKYVPNVMSTYKNYKSKFENYRIDSVYLYTNK